MTARRKRGAWSGGGMTRLERAMGGNTAQDRKDIAAAAAVPHNRRYHEDLDQIDQEAAAKAAAVKSK